MIAGTPVLDIKPYIPEYDSPNTRMDMDSEPCDSNADQPGGTTVPLDESEEMLNLQNDSETDAQSDLESVLARETTEADSSGVAAPFSLPKHLHNVLEDVKTYVTQGDLFQLRCESDDQVSDSTKSKPQESSVEHPCYGEEAYSTIAGWIREPPVGSLEVRFTPQAERELAEFLPAHQSGKIEFQCALYDDEARLMFCFSPQEGAVAKEMNKNIVALHDHRALGE